MTTLSLAGSLYCTLLTIGLHSYAEAHRETSETGKPMVVMVGADWCGPCQNMKNNVLPQLRRRGLLSRVAFALVNIDREPELGRNLTGGGPIPQMVMFSRTSAGWKRQRLVGLQSVGQVEQFLNEGLASDTAGNKTAEPNQTAKPGIPAAEPVIKAVSNR